MPNRKTTPERDLEERWAKQANKNPDDPQMTPVPDGAQAIAKRRGAKRPSPKAGASARRGDDDSLVELGSPDDIEDF